MSIIYSAEEIDFPPIDQAQVTAWIAKVAATHSRKLGEVSYIFCSDEYILKMNNEYLQHDYYTDIITFDYCEDDTISGDIFISLDTVRSNSEQFNTDYLQELHRVIIHGILHLCGFNDHSDEEEQTMRTLENEALASILKQ